MSGHDFISRAELLGNLKATMRENGLDPENEAHWKVPIWDARMFDVLMDLTPDADVVPMDYHERCMQLEIQKRIDAEKTAREIKENYEPVKRGRWIPDERSMIIAARSNGRTCVILMCSECKTSGSPMWKRCPVCEAKMYASKEE